MGLSAILWYNRGYLPVILDYEVLIALYLVTTLFAFS